MDPFTGKGSLPWDRTCAYAFLELPLLLSLRRARRRRRADRIEKKAVLFHKRVRRGYLKIAKREPKRFKRIVIRKKDSISDVHEKIMGALSDVL